MPCGTERNHIVKYCLTLYSHSLIISLPANRLELEERKQRSEGDRLRSLISSQKQEFEKSLYI
jgi:hypothetical protein